MSPIRAENRGRYPDDWEQISHAVKDRARWRCECLGECGGHHAAPCDREHGETIHRPNHTRYVVVLTAAHLNHIPEDCRPENLKAYCQSCHLAYDADHHAQSREHHNRLDAEAKGQQVLWEQAPEVTSGRP